MGLSVTQSYLSDMLHIVSQVLLVPTIIVLLVLIGYALFCIGSIVAEYVTEHRLYKVSMPTFLSDLMEASQEDIPNVIKGAGLLNRQKQALLTVYDYRTLPGDALVALIRRLVSEEETHYNRIVGRNNTAARISPMIGLMGTLIPLGPGVEALGRADTAALSSSLLIAFDTTVAGLVVAAICLLIAKIRTNWYGDYMSALDSGMATMLEKIEEMREAGEIQVKKPANYRFLYGGADERIVEGGEASAADAAAAPTAPTAATVAAAAPITATAAAVAGEAPYPTASAAPAVAAGEAAVAIDAAGETAEAVTTVGDAYEQAVDTAASQLLKEPVGIDAAAVLEAASPEVPAQGGALNEIDSE